MNNQITKLPPPQGHHSWIEYAIATFDSRSLVTDYEPDDERPVTKEAVIAAVWLEYNELRRMAGLEPIEPKNLNQSSSD